MAIASRPADETNAQQLTVDSSARVVIHNAGHRLHLGDWRRWIIGKARHCVWCRWLRGCSIVLRHLSGCMTSDFFLDLIVGSFNLLKYVFRVSTESPLPCVSIIIQAYQWSRPIPTSLKLIHSRVYAQAITLGALGAVAGIELYAQSKKDDADHASSGE